MKKMLVENEKDSIPLYNLKYEETAVLYTKYIMYKAYYAQSTRSINVCAVYIRLAQQKVPLYNQVPCIT